MSRACATAQASSCSSPRWRCSHEQHTAPLCCPCPHALFPLDGCLCGCHISAANREFARYATDDHCGVCHARDVVADGLCLACYQQSVADLVEVVAALTRRHDALVKALQQIDLFTADEQGNVSAAVLSIAHGALAALDQAEVE